MKKVAAGDPLVIPAPTFNAFIDAAEDFRRRQHDIRSRTRPEVRRTDIVLVRNDSGADRERFDVLGISGIAITPTDNQAAFEQHVVLSGGVPSSGHAGKFVVLLEPVAAGALGRGCIDGVCVARVEMTVESDAYADAKPSAADVLRSSPDGTARLLWVQPEADRDDPSIAWTVIHLGGGGDAIVMVKAKRTGGGAGDDDTACSYTYTIYAATAPELTSEYELASGLTPQYHQRTATGKYVAPAAGSWAQAFRVDGQWVLWAVAGEVPDVLMCDGS